MKNLLIKNAAVVFPDSIKHSCNVLTLNGKISDCDFRGDPPENTEIINAEGNVKEYPIKNAAAGCKCPDCCADAKITGRWKVI